MPRGSSALASANTACGNGFEQSLTSPDAPAVFGPCFIPLALAGPGTDVNSTRFVPRPYSQLVQVGLWLILSLEQAAMQMLSLAWVLS